MEGRERSERAPVVVDHGGTHSGEVSAMAELADPAKRVLTGAQTMRKME
jgi:hypothetical protein